MPTDAGRGTYPTDWRNSVERAVIAWDCTGRRRLPPHHHAWIHGRSIGGGLLFVLPAIIIGHRITDDKDGANHA